MLLLPTGASERSEQEMDAAVPAVRELLQQAVQARAGAVRGRHLLHRRRYTTVSIFIVCFSSLVCFLYKFDTHETSFLIRLRLEFHSRGG